MNVEHEGRHGRDHPDDSDFAAAVVGECSQSAAKIHQGSWAPAQTACTSFFVALLVFGLAEAGSADPLMVIVPDSHASVSMAPGGSVSIPLQFVNGDTPTRTILTAKLGLTLATDDGIPVGDQVSIVSAPPSLTPLFDPSSLRLSSINDVSVVEDVSLGLGVTLGPMEIGEFGLVDLVASPLAAGRFNLLMEPFDNGSATDSSYLCVEATPPLIPQLYPFDNPGQSEPDGRILLASIQVGPIAGDYNLDGSVDVNDYAKWRSDFGDTVSIAGTGADGNGDQIVDSADYVFWRDHLPSPNGLAVSTNGHQQASGVPEPATDIPVILCASLGLALASRRPSC